MQQQPQSFKTSDVKLAAYILYRGGHLDSVEQSAPAFYNFVFSGFPDGADAGPGPDESVELRRFLEAERELRSLIALAKRGVAWRAW